MSAFLYPVLDGVAPSWADIAVRITPNGGNLIEMGDIQSISSGSTVEVGEQREGGRLIKRTTGSVSHESSMTLYKSGWRKLLQGLAASAPSRGNQRRVSLVHFSLNIQWTPPGSADIFERRIKGCRILGNANDSSEGTDAALIEVPLSPLEIADVVDGVEYVLL
jgi:hypothetical protein